MNSLRAKLLALLLVIISLAWLATALFSYIDAHHEIDELFDAQLSQSAKVLVAQAAHELRDAHEAEERVAAEVAVGGHKYERKIAFQIWDAHGKLLLRSASAPDRPLSMRESGYSDVAIDGKAWRVYTQWDDEGEIRVLVGERHEVRAELAAHIAKRLLLPMGVALPVLALLLWFGVGKGLAPLQRIGTEVSARDPHMLAPLDDRAIPAEIAPLVSSLNELFARLEHALESERRFTADAAHELRTPLSALKTQAQVAQRAGSDEQRRTALENLILGVDRATHLVEQLLTLARLDPAAESAALKEGCDLVAVARQILADLAPAALAKGIECELTGPESAPVRGDAGMLGILLRNLADNAIRYTPQHGRIKVELKRNNEGGVRLEVVDSGPGIPAQERQRVFDRFYRVLGSDAPGSGLGLSIVKRIADLHGALVTLGEGEGGAGLKVTLQFPGVRR